MPKTAIFLALIFWLIAPAQAVADPVEDPEELEKLAAPDSAYYRYLREHRLRCSADTEVLDEPVEIKIGKRTWLYTGPELRAKSRDPDGIVRLGVMGAIKDFSPDTRRTLAWFLKRFRKERVDALVLLGDVAASEHELTQVLVYCAKTRLPVLALIGNTESRAAFNRSVLAALRVAPNVINMDFVRRVDMGGAVLVGLPGYRNRKFVHATGGCTYKPRDVERMVSIIGETDDPVVFMAHGPPKGAGKRDLDFATDAGNVGDPDVARFLHENEIPFGIFSHILEAGGNARNHKGRRVKPKRWARRLFINVGSANPLEWTLNSGRVSCGMAAIFRIKGKQASYSWLRRPCRR